MGVVIMTNLNPNKETLSKEDAAVIWIMHTPRGTFEFGYKAGEDPTPFEKPPIWMSDLSKKWDNPQDPVTFEFTLSDESYVQDAFNYLHNGPVNGISYPVEEGQS